MRRKAELSTSTNEPEQTRDRHGFRGVPPPPTFSLGALADDCLLTEFEVAAVLRVSTNSVEGWRRQPNHALAWEVLPGGFVRYRAGHIRRYLTMGSPRKGRRAKPPARASQRRASKPNDALTTEGAAPPRRRARARADDLAATSE
jgi:hypothetical protein